MKNKAFYVAYQVLKKVYENKAYSQIELNAHLEKLDNEQDKALITKLVYGVLENNIQLEYYLKQFIQKEPKQNTYFVLKMGAFCALYLNIPSYAYVNELVELTKLVAKQGEVGFVNKVLKLTSNTPLVLPNETDELNYLSVKHSYPMWLIKKLKKQYGSSVLQQLLNSEKSKLKHIRLNLNEIKLEEFLKKLNNKGILYKLSPLQNGLFVEYSKLLKQKELSNYYTVQSLGSMLIVEELNVKNGTNILDVCAAPGGKTCYIAEKNNNGSVLAFDLYDHRVELIKKYASKMKLSNVTAIQKDATVLEKNYIEQFDAVLCDVPCSGIGIVQKKPDILLFREERSINELKKLQQQIILTASQYVKKGGTLVYSTCTLLKEENIEVVNDFLKNNNEFYLDEIKVSDIEHIKEKGTITILPNKEGQEGYFIARFIKK